MNKRLRSNGGASAKINEATPVAGISGSKGPALPLSMEVSGVKQLTAPEVFLTVLTEVFRKAKKNPSLPFPLQAGRFRFVKAIMEDRNHNNFQFGLYESEGVTYFAKMIGLKRHSLENYWFRKEVLTLKIVESAFERMSNGKETEIKFPQIRGVFEDSDRFLAIYVYIPEASTLDEIGLTVGEKVKFLEKIAGHFSRLNSYLTPEEKSQISKRPTVYYFLTFWFVFIRAIVRFPGRIKEILALVIKFCRNAGCIFRKGELVFSHRDVNPSNVLITSKGDTYVIDFEVAVMTHPLCTIVGMGIAAGRRPGLLEEFDKTAIMQEIHRNKKDREAFTFLSIYSCMHSLAMVPPWRLDRTFTYLKYCLDL